MYRRPSRKFRAKETERPNLIPILDAVFIFIIFLLTTANFLELSEISSEVPLVSTAPPPKEKPLALTLEIRENDLAIYSGVPSILKNRFSNLEKNLYNLEELHQYLIQIKEKNPLEQTLIIDPLVDIEYEKLVEIMDAVRLLRKTDPAIYLKDKDGIDVRTNELFPNIIFGNTQS